MKRYTWTGPDRLVPGIGIVARGDAIPLTEERAKDFIARGLVKQRTTAKPAEPKKEGGE